MAYILWSAYPSCTCPPWPSLWTHRNDLILGSLQVIAAEARNKELQEELTATYKKNSGLNEDLMAAQRRLQIVRESNEAQVSAALLPHGW